MLNAWREYAVEEVKIGPMFYRIQVCAYVRAYSRKLRLCVLARVSRHKALPCSDSLTCAGQDSLHLHTLTSADIVQTRLAGKVVKYWFGYSKKISAGKKKLQMLFFFQIAEVVWYQWVHHTLAQKASILGLVERLTWCVIRK